MMVAVKTLLVWYFNWNCHKWLESFWLNDGFWQGGPLPVHVTDLFNKRIWVEGSWYIVYTHVVCIVFLLNICIKSNILSRKEKWSVLPWIFFILLFSFVLRYTLTLLIWLSEIFMSLGLLLAQVLWCQCHLGGRTVEKHTSVTSHIKKKKERKRRSRA